jgi:NADPH-dependent curcumin reductase CurA
MKQVVLRHPLREKPVAADFQLMEALPPKCPDGGVLARVAHVSLDPYVGARLRGRHMGEAPPRPGVDPIPGAVVAQVIESRQSGLAPGDWVHAMDGGWAEIVALTSANKRDAALASLSAYAGVLGMPGLTAWAGITQLAEVGAGDVVLVDAAAGPVGGAVGQIARINGAKRVVGIAGGPEKCALVTGLYGFDACIDYKAEGWREALAAALPEPVTVHFENVSVTMLTAAMGHLAPYGRVVLCGLADHYQADAAPAAVPAGLIIGKRARLMGLVVYDFYTRWEEFLAEAGPWVRDGRLRIAEDRAFGLEQAPALFERLMNGANLGKAVVTLAEAFA